eukprot:Platyproteum_vivax@DN16517_c0_g1_i1.p1
MASNEKAHVEIINVYETLSNKTFTPAVEKSVVFIGNNGSGKTSLVDTFISAKEIGVPKTTSGVQYRYGKVQDGNRKQIAHLYDVGHGMTRLPVTPNIVVIAVDISEPHNVLHAIKHHLACVLKSPNPNESAPVIIALTKWDLFSHKFDPEHRKWLYKAVRQISFTNNCSVISVTVTDPHRATAFKSFLRGVVFKGRLKGENQTNPHEGLFIVAGTDSLEDIGEADCGTWEKTIEHYFGPVLNKSVEPDLKAFSEPAIDDLL